jgi:hypothetical protein
MYIYIYIYSTEKEHPVVYIYIHFGCHMIQKMSERKYYYK